MVVSNIFEKIPEVFCDKPLGCSNEYIKIYGRAFNKRTYRFLPRKYLINNDYLDYYNVLLPEANGSNPVGTDGKTPVIGMPFLAKPGEGATDTYLSIGAFNNLFEAESLLKYIKSKFARTLLGIKKATQHNPKATWIYVPLQDFTSNSDIDWSKSISDIDKQLYKKYNLSQDEIDFIESHVKEME